MAIAYDITDTSSQDAGAFSLDDNIATTAGYATIAAGGLLACAVGTMVAPAPTLGLMTIGGGVVCATKYKEIKSHFVGDTVAPATRRGTADATEGGRYKSTEDAGTDAVPVATVEVAAN